MPASAGQCGSLDGSTVEEVIVVFEVPDLKHKHSMLGL